MSKRKAWEYSLQVKNGVCGRDKKPKLYSFTILETDTEEKIKPEDVLILIKAKLADVKYKFGHLTLVEYPLSLEDQASHSGRASRSKVVMITKGVVIWRSMGLNLTEIGK